MASLRTPSPSPAALLFSRPSFRPKPRPRISLSLLGDSSSPSSASPGLVDAAGLKRASSGALGQSDLLIVGPGVLGRIVAEKWQKEHLDCQIWGQTMTNDHQDELIKLGIIPSLRGSEHNHKFPYVIFCAPPSRTPDYPDRLHRTGAVKDSPLVAIGKSPRTDVLLRAEKETLDVGGCVVRLAGLYKEDRGAHTYWLEKGLVDARPDHMVNLIHYEDAASLAVTIMTKKLRGQIFLGCDNYPVSRQEIMDYVNRCGKFSKKFGKFTASEGPLGKRMNNSKTRAALGWEPKFTSFPEFLGLSV